jgi:hypothetical protein
MRETQEVPHPRSFNRRFQRVLVRLGGMGVFILGTVVSLMIEGIEETRYFAEYFQGHHSYWENWIDYQPFLFGGMILSFLASL